jgi:transcriptional regulator with XRE-family HTH domain
LADAEDLAVGARIKALRVQQRWSALRLAEECERAGMTSLSRSVISKLETGRRKLKADEAVRLAGIFGVTTDFLLKGVPSEEGSSRREPMPTARQAPYAGEAAQEELPVLGEVPRAEVDQIMSWLESGRGPQALLVLGPPGVGKSTLVSQLIREAEADRGWATTLLDVRAQEPEARMDAEVLISRMFPLEEPAQTDMEMFAETVAHRRIAQRISKAGKPLLCVLDTADELTDGTSARLRSALSAVYSQVQRTGKPGVKLAFVVASRLEDGWLGMTQTPVFAVRPLSEFGLEVVEDRLRLMASRTQRSFSAAEFASMASVAYAVSAGLPPLLDPILSWVEDEVWLDIHRLEGAGISESLTQPYIRDTLLAPQSLFPRAVQVPREQLEAVRKAISLLVRYRLFTHSHMLHHLDIDGEFRENLKNAGWKPGDLWQALSEMALLKKPLDEMWQEFHPAIRRLLFRHYYPSPERRALAHREARAYLAEWAAAQPRKDRVVGRVEELWHAVSTLRLEEAPDLREQLLPAAREAGTGLDVSDTYPLNDLSSYAADRITRDAELQAAIGDAGLAVELNDTVLAWSPSGHGSRSDDR